MEDKMIKIENHNSITIITNPIFCLIIFGELNYINKYGKEYYQQKNNDIVINTKIEDNINIKELYNNKNNLINLIYLINLYYQYNDLIQKDGKIIVPLKKYINKLHNRCIKTGDIEKENYYRLFNIIDNIVLDIEKNNDSKNTIGKKNIYITNLIDELNSLNQLKLFNIKIDKIKSTDYIIIKQNQMLDIFQKYGLNNLFPYLHFVKLFSKSDMNFYLSLQFFIYERIGFKKGKEFNVGLLTILKSYKIGVDVIEQINTSSRKKELLNKKVINPLVDVLSILFELDKLFSIKILDDLDKELVIISKKDNLNNLYEIIDKRNYKYIKFKIKFNNNSK